MSGFVKLLPYVIWEHIVSWIFLALGTTGRRRPQHWVQIS